MNKKHDWRLDLIKVIAIIMVLYNHLYCYDFILSYKMDEIHFIHYLLLIPSIICKCGPVLFFMVSGVVLLGKNEPYRVILKKRAVRILAIMVMISVIKGICGGSGMLILQTFMGGLNWYLYAYLAFLLMLPVLRRIAQNFSDDEWKWYIVIVVILNCALAYMAEFEQSFSTFSNMPMIAAPWASASWHIVFPLLGYGIYHKRYIIKKNWLYAGSGIALLGAMGGIIIDMRMNGGNNFEMMNQFFNVLPSCTFFYLVTGIGERETVCVKNLKQIALKIAPLTFGMFLIDTHTFMRGRIYSAFFKENVMGVRGILASWWILVLEFVIYACITWCLRCIPAIRKVL